MNTDLLDLEIRGTNQCRSVKIRVLFLFGPAGLSEPKGSGREANSCISRRDAESAENKIHFIVETKKSETPSAVVCQNTHNPLGVQDFSHLGDDLLRVIVDQNVGPLGQRNGPLGCISEGDARDVENRRLFLDTA
jgi:hypothetical protein